MELGAHLPLIALGGEPFSLRRLTDYTAAAGRLGYRALCANDHLVYPKPWLDGPAALAAVLEHSGTMELRTTVSLPVVRGPVALASGSNATPGAFGAAWQKLRTMLSERARDADRFPNGIATMFCYVTEDRSRADRVIDGFLAPMLNRPREELTDRLLVGSAESCAEKLAAYARAGAQRAFLWPVADELQQLELFRERVAPLAAQLSA